jgi:hypothetical protein
MKEYGNHKSGGTIANPNDDLYCSILAHLKTQIRDAAYENVNQELSCLCYGAGMATCLASNRCATS